MKRVHLVVGMPMSGKTLYAKDLAKSLDFEMVHLVKYLYGKSYEEALEALHRDLDFKKGKYVIQGVCWEPESDDKTWRFFQDLIKYVDKVWLVRPIGKYLMVSRTIESDLDLQTKTEFIIRSLETYEQHVEKLQYVECMLAHKRIHTEIIEKCS